MQSFTPPSTPHRSFMFAYHPTHGLLLLLSTKSGRPHQLPGGRVDSSDYPPLALTESSYLSLGAERGLEREAMEETGLDVSGRLQPMRMLLDPSRVPPQPGGEGGGGIGMNEGREEHGGKYVCHEYKLRWFFTVRLTDSDLSCFEPGSPGVVECGTRGCGARLRLSDEHSAFYFVKDLLEVSALVKGHSKGVPSEAVIMAMRCREWEKEVRDRGR